MTASVQKTLPPSGALLPRRAREERSLVFILSAMVFLAALTLLVFLAGMRASKAWQLDLAQTLTIQVYDDGKVDQETLKKDVVNIARSALPKSRVSLLSDSDSRALLSPWLGQTILPEDIPMPLVLRVKLGSNVPPDVEAIKTAYDRAGVETDVDDHSRWGKNMKRTWRAVQIGMGAIIMIVLGASAAVSAYATQSVMRARQTIIDVLAHVGARDSFIASLFLKRFTVLGMLAGLIGSLLAVLFLILFAGATKTYAVDVVPVTGLQAPDFIYLVVLIIASGLICGFTAGLATLSKLRRDRRAV